MFNSFSLSNVWNSDYFDINVNLYFRH